MRMPSAMPIRLLFGNLKAVPRRDRLSLSYASGSRADDLLKHLFSLVTSVDGVGEAAAAAVVFCEMVIATRWAPPMSLGCLAVPESLSLGDPIAIRGWPPLIGPPKRHTSGTSIRGGTRRGRPAVSHLANKQMKKLLHMAALSVVSGKGEMADYYHRKVE